jgi:hypothetical protein
MRTDPKIKKKLMIDAKEGRQKYIEVFDVYIKELDLAKSVEDIMKAKRKLLLDLVHELPTDSGSCYFCLENAIDKDPFVDCNPCKYAKIHKVCRDLESDWYRLNQAKYRLVSIIRVWYYRGEKYKKQ